MYDGNTLKKLGDYSLTTNAHIQLIILLYAIPEGSSIKTLVFDLFWGYPIKLIRDYLEIYPATGPDFLDGTCVIYSGASTVDMVDYSHKSAVSGLVTHSGDVMDESNRIGHHTIIVQLEQLPNHINQLFFILSAYNSPTIGYFPNPSVKLFDQAKPTIELCGYAITTTPKSQAAIMCSVSNILQIAYIKDYTTDRIWVDS